MSSNSLTRSALTSSALLSFSRQYADPIIVRPASEEADSIGVAPTQFLWRDRLYLVRAVLASWVEVGPWWQRSATQLQDEEYLMWRVEAGPGRRAPVGHYELCQRKPDGRWFLLRTFD